MSDDDEFEARRAEPTALTRKTGCPSCGSRRALVGWAGATNRVICGGCRTELVAAPEVGEAVEALRVMLEQQHLGRQCSRCGGEWEAHRPVTLLGGMKVPCPLAHPCAIVDRYDRSRK